ncbi:hypothetical protein F5141DRAFT_1218333 [Pisolithus sp. B1]|nr:hypothetical protein F5141DRAFT_1218333 [Pisolithus sp. B1]
MSEAQRASLAIAHEQRAAKKALLDKAIQEYLTQQTSKMEEVVLKHSVTVEYLKGLVGGQTHYYSSWKVQQHNALLHAKALEVNAEFWEDVFGHQVADVAHQYEQWACTQNQNLLEHDSLGSLHKQITKAISSSLIMSIFLGPHHD